MMEAMEEPLVSELGGKHLGASKMNTIGCHNSIILSALR